MKIVVELDREENELLAVMRKNDANAISALSIPKYRRMLNLTAQLAYIHNAFAYDGPYAVELHNIGLSHEGKMDLIIKSNRE
jgi:hypothetical protein